MKTWLPKFAALCIVAGLAPSVWAETKSYYLTESQLNHFTNLAVTKEASDAAETASDSDWENRAGVIGSRLATIGIELEDVSFPKPWKMEVTADEKNLAKLEKRLDFFRDDRFARFRCWAIEVDSSETTELETLLPGITDSDETSAIAAGKEDLDALLARLGEQPGLDLLCAPTVITRSGDQAKIEVVREFIYPSEYDPPEIPEDLRTKKDAKNPKKRGEAASEKSFPVTPASPTAFETRNLGVTIAIDPTIEIDGTIQSSLAAEVSEFEGFQNYGTPITTVAKNALGKPVSVVLTESRIEMPIFKTRMVSGTHRFRDGDYAITGGADSRRHPGDRGQVSLLPPQVEEGGQADVVFHRRRRFGDDRRRTNGKIAAACSDWRLCVE